MLIETSGLAYEIVLPPCVAEKIRDVDERTPVTLEILASLAIDGNSGRFTYFGFTDAVERDFFEALTSVASIGPRTAARAFTHPMSRIARAIDADDQAFLVKLPGIGKQKAREIVAKLQGKVTRFLLIRDAEPFATPTPIPDFGEEALAVLLALRYERTDAQAMIAQALALAPQVNDAESLLAEIYRRRTPEGST